MKQIVAILLTATALLLPLSCEKRESSNDTGTNAGNTSEFKPVSTPRKQDRVGYAIRAAGLYELKDGVGTWKAGTFLGEKLTMTGETSKAKINNFDYDVTEVTRITGDTLWIINMTFAPDAELAVINSKETIFLATAPQAATYTTVSVDYLQLIAVYPETETNNFVKTHLYIPNKDDPSKVGAYYGHTDRASRYIRNNTYSTREADVQSAILWHTAMASNNEERKTALLQSALNDYPNSVFANDIRAELKTEEVIETVSINLEMSVIASNISVYAKPAEDSVRVGGIRKDEIVTAVEKTKTTLSFDGNSDFWYRIDEPLTGWIFGGFLEEYSPVGDEWDEDW